MKNLFKKLEQWAQNYFCNPDDCYPIKGSGGRKAHLNDAQRNAEEKLYSKIPTFKQIFK